MKKNNVFPHIIIVFGIVGFVLFLGTLNRGDSMAYSASSLTIVQESFDFETISMADGIVMHDFVLANDGTESVYITKAYTSCMCTEAIIQNESGQEYGPYGMQGHGGSASAKVEVVPGQSVTVRAVFDPAAHGPSGVGLAKRTIYLETNSSIEPKIELAFKAMVTQ